MRPDEEVIKELDDCTQEVLDRLKDVSTAIAKLQAVTCGTPDEDNEEEKKKAIGFLMELDHRVAIVVRQSFTQYGNFLFI